MKIAITGGAGFIGSHIADAVLAAGHEVVVLDTLETGREENIAHIKDRITFIKGSITDMEALAKAFAGVEVVFHEAALPSVPKSLEMPLETHAANATGTMNVLIAARDAGVRRVIYASSSSVYGDSEVSPKVETLPYNPLSLYALHKMYGELSAKMATKYYNLETIGLRYFNVFGPRQNPNSKYAAVIPLFISKINAGEEILVNGDGSVSRDFTYIANVVQANMKALLAPKTASGQVFNVACGDSVTLLELISTIENKVGKKARVNFGPSRPGDIAYSLADITKAREVLGFNPAISFAEGISLTAKSLL